ncbi:CBS domain-containing protein [Acrocarpospora sp. B8E8]|uniref:CBS domain-containing protein n=1 Tax=Acrocarpospora sp. B8E8 TaxID=3153572 RepID=UPI00325DE548
MLVREVMSSPVITLRSGEAVREAIRVLYANNITAAPVLGDHGELVGIASEMDLLCGAFLPDPRASARPLVDSEEPAPRHVADVMSREVVTVSETTDIALLIDLLVAKRIKSVPVLRDGELVGMVSRRDLIGMLARSDTALRAAVMSALREQYPSGPSWGVTVHEGEVVLHGHAGERIDRIADLLTRTVPGVSRVRHV